MLAVIAFSLTLTLSLSAAVDDEAGFGGAADEPAGDQLAAPVDDASDPAARPAATADFATGAGSRALAAFPEPKPEDSAPKKTALELELEKARMDPAQHPLLALRVEVARARLVVEDGRKGGLYAIKDEEVTLAGLEAVLADVERIALHRMNVCMTRNGKNVVVKNYRMTAAGPIRLSTAELLSQASLVDPDGCGRIFLVDAAVVARVRRAHELQQILETERFGYHDVPRRRALEQEQAAILKELAKEDLPIMSLPGAVDPHRR